MAYFSVSPKEITDAQAGIQLIRWLPKGNDLDIYLYGLTSAPEILDAAQEAIFDDAGTDEDDNPLSEEVNLKAVAIVIYLSSEVIGYLEGSGLKLEYDEFAYLAPGEGPRTLSFQWVKPVPKIRLDQFSELAISDSADELDSFLKAHVSNNKPKIVRNEKAAE